MASKQNETIHLSQEYHIKPGRFVALCGGPCPVSSLTARRTPPKLGVAIRPRRPVARALSPTRNLQNPASAGFFSPWLRTKRGRPLSKHALQRLPDGGYALHPDGRASGWTRSREWVD